MMIAYLEDSPARATKEDKINYVMNKKISELVFKSVSGKIPACRKSSLKSRYLVSFHLHKSHPVMLVPATSELVR